MDSETRGQMINFDKLQGYSVLFKRIQSRILIEQK